jgi:solute carrier family 25 (mitochondrial oxoglutarate transporter), member 11
MAWTVVHPINTLSVKRNLAAAIDSAAPKRSIKAMLHDFGVRGLYAGLSAGYTRQIFYTTCQVGMFETLRDEVAKYAALDIGARLLIGCASGAVAALVSCPAEVALVRMSNDASLPGAQQRRYKNVFDAGFRIIREEGVLRLFSGCGPFVGRAILVGAFQIGTYDHFKGWFCSVGVKDPLANVTAASFAAGAVYSFITMPLETAKNQLAFLRRSSDGAPVSTRRVIASTVRRHGVPGLWSGFGPYYVRCSVFSVCMFVSVEWLRQLYSRASRHAPQTPQ